MASSPTELLTELEAIYSDGLEAVLSDDMQRVVPLLDRADKLIAQLPAPSADDPAANDAREAARAAWSRMCGAVKAATEQTRDELAANRKRRRVTRAYGSGRSKQVARHRADA